MTEEMLEEIDQEQSTIHEGVKRFSELELSDATFAALEAMGFVEPTPVQALTLPVTLNGTDVIGQAHTGTGKTAAFAIPMAERLDPTQKKIQAVVLTPTRELAIQVSEEINRIVSRKGLKVVPVYGGEDIRRQFRKLERGAHIVVGTPGRFIDHLERKTFNLDDVSIAVLDEADEMLDMGFYDDMVYVLKQAPKKRQTLLFSATMPPAIERLGRRFLTNPEKVALNTGQMTVENTRQLFYEVPDNKRLDALCRILDYEGEWSSRRGPMGRVIIFCRTKWETDELGTRLQGRGYASAGLHGDLNQSKRRKVLDAFKEGIIQVLVATDVAARGLDISGVTHVVNYHIPPTHEDYVHRVGRTGRAGQTGVAITFVSPKEYYELIRIQEGANVDIEQQEIPTNEEVARRRLEQLMDRVRYASEAIDRTDEAKRLLETLTPEQAVAGLVTLLREEERELALRSRLQGGPADGTTRLFMTIGKKDNMTPEGLSEVVAVIAGIESHHIAKVEIFDNYTYLEVPSPIAGEIIAALQEKPVGGRRVKVEEARPAGGGRKGKRDNRHPRKKRR